MPSDDSNVISLELHKRTPRPPPHRLYRRIRVRPGYHILVSLAPEFDARVYYVSRNYKLHPSGWIAQCEQTFMIPADPVARFDTFSQAIAFVADDIRLYNLSITS